MTGLDPITSDLSISFCYFELDEKINAKFSTYKKYAITAGHAVSETILIILKFLITYILSV